MGYLIWGVTTSAAGAAALVVGGVANIEIAATGVIVSVAALVGVVVWRMGRFDRERDLPKD